MADLEAIKKRRDDYLKRLGPSSAALLHSPPELLRNGDAHYPFRQNSDIVYLTGFTEPGTTILLRPGAEEPLVMFVRPRDPEREIWDGRRAGVEGAMETFGADAAHPNTDLAKLLPELIANIDELHYSLGDNRGFDDLVIRTIAGLRRKERRGLRPPKRIADPRFNLHEMRLVKQADEIDTLRRAAEITCEAHRLAMAAAGSGVKEYELEAMVNGHFRRNGGTGPGYTSIVGAGKNATILHYIENNDTIDEGDLVLIDAGCELDCYTADVTRTFPASGKFSAPQRKLYNVVLEAELGAIEMTKPGVTIEEIHERTVEILTEGLVTVGLLEGPSADRIADESYKRYYMHRTSHWLGLDVHDVGTYTIDGTHRPLAPGMVITIEPGIYVGADDETASEEFRGIGIRIEDDILITENGNDVLTAAVPKQLDEVEAACRNSP